VASRIVAAKTIAMTAATAAWAAITKAAAASMAFLRGVILAVNIAMYANPIGLVIAAVVALIGVAGLLIANWGQVGAFFAGLWDGIVAKFTATVEKITGIFSGVTDLFGSIGDLINFDSIFGGLVSSAEKALSDILGIFSGVQDAFRAVGDFFGFGGDAETPAPRAPAEAAPAAAGDGVSSPQEGIVRSLNEYRCTAEVTLRNETGARAEVTQQSGAMSIHIDNSGAFAS